MPHTTVTVSQRQGYTHTVYARTHELIADEPASEDGNDLGPTPFELLLAAMASCSAITIEMYARRKQWDVTGVEISADWDREARSVSMDIALTGDLDEQQSARLEEIASRCPVVRAVREGIGVTKCVVTHRT